MSNNCHWSNLIKSPVDRLKWIFGQQFYDVCGCKILGRQLKPVVKYLSGRKDLKIILLTRDNAWDQAISWEINNLVRKAHRFEGQNFEAPANVKLSRKKVSSRYEEVLRNQTRNFVAASKIADFITLTYEQITGGAEANQVPSEVGRLICDFLEVPVHPLYTRMLKVNRRPWEDVISNWREIDDLIRNS